jgi:hypothetical protein
MGVALTGPGGLVVGVASEAHATIKESRARETPVTKSLTRLVFAMRAPPPQIFGYKMARDPPGANVFDTGVRRIPWQKIAYSGGNASPSR